MNQENQTQIDETIATLHQYVTVTEELRQAKTFGHIDKGGHNLRVESAQAKFDALVIPSREEAESACMQEIQNLITAWQQEHASFKAAVQAEMEAWIQRDAARIRLGYAETAPILGLKTQEASRAAHQMQEAYNTAEYRRKVAENKWDITYKQLVTYGVDPRDPSNFAAAAQRRVESLLGAVYDRQHVADLKTQLGLTDKMLAQLGTT